MQPARGPASDLVEDDWTSVHSREHTHAGSRTYVRRIVCSLKEGKADVLLTSYHLFAPSLRGTLDGISRVWREVHAELQAGEHAGAERNAEKAANWISKSSKGMGGGGEMERWCSRPVIHIWANPDDVFDRITAANKTVMSARVWCVCRSVCEIVFATYRVPKSSFY